MNRAIALVLSASAILLLAAAAARPMKAMPKNGLLPTMQPSSTSSMPITTAS